MNAPQAVRTGFDFSKYAAKPAGPTDAEVKLTAVFRQANERNTPGVNLICMVDFTAGGHRTEDRKRLVGLHYLGSRPVDVPAEKVFEFTEADLQAALLAAGWMVEGKIKLQGQFRFRYRFAPADEWHRAQPDPAIATEIGRLRGVDAEFVEEKRTRERLLSMARAASVLLIVLLLSLAPAAVRAQDPATSDAAGTTVYMPFGRFCKGIAYSAENAWMGTIMTIDGDHKAYIEYTTSGGGSKTFDLHPLRWCFHAGVYCIPQAPCAVEIIIDDPYTNGCLRSGIIRDYGGGRMAVRLDTVTDCEPTLSRQSEEIGDPISTRDYQVFLPVASGQ